MRRAGRIGMGEEDGLNEWEVNIRMGEKVRVARNSYAEAGKVRKYSSSEQRNL